MPKLLRYCVLTAVIAAVTPSTAGAQVYPDRIAVKARVAAVAYQRRTRDDNREEQTERTTKTFKLGSDGSLDLGNISGDITITRGSGSDATVQIVKTARGRDAADVKEQLALVTVDIMEREGRAELKAHYPNNQRRNLNVSIDFIVSAPSGTRVTATSISGNVKITDIKGDLNANTISGDVTISGAGRINTAKTISGTIEISDVKSDTGIDASTISGDVRLRHVSARRIGGGTVSGDVRLEDVDTQNVSVHSTNGSITFSGPLTERGRYELKAFSGDVRLTLTGKTGFDVEANSFSGDITTDFPLTTHGTTDARGRSAHRTSLRGTFGDGGAVIQITTFNGSIVIGKK